jgi:leukotriene-A4 hydrolase
MKKIVLLLSVILIIAGCKNKTTSTQVRNHSYSNYDAATCTHLQWDASINFDKKVIEATATWGFTNTKNTDELVLDTKDLNINAVSVNGRNLRYILDTAKHLYLGSALHIPIQKNDSIVAIKYTTSATADALQWLSPAQTADKKMPYLFTQCESIAARSIIPCQDAPANRITYTANITVPKGMMAVMSADNPQQRNAEGKYNFVMNIPVPTYLIALAVGDINFKAIDGRSGVYAEPSMLAKAAAELSDIPAMISAAEALAGPYKWGRYDVLIQPPSFPIGGMENPKLTFATPTILAGDKSLVSLVAHELAHSWSGNTVTNATWNDLWLNEGFTTYFERRIMEKITDKTYTDMLWELSYQDMMVDVNDSNLAREDLALKLNLDNRDPGDAFTNIPYEKGAHLLWLIEQQVGREKWDAFTVKYFNENAFKPMTTEIALAYMKQHLPQAFEKVNIDEWVYKPLIPKNCPRPAFERFNKVDSVRNNFIKNNSILASATKSWSTHEWLQFLRKLPRNLSTDKIAQLDKTFNLTNTTNNEIAFEWFMLGIPNNYAAINNKLEKFLLSVGRKKFVKPLYSKMMEQAASATLAKSIFEQAKLNYHPATTEAISSVVK